MNNSNMNDNDYPEAELMPTNNAAVEQMERAQIDVQIATAKKYPRSIKQVKLEMLSMATMDVETAESCFYNLPRGGKSIPGPSIRLAEIALSCFGNVRVATRIIGSNLSDDPHVVIQAVCHDLEKNSAISIEKRRRITKKKSKDKIDEDDINLATNACSAIALRDAIFKIVPGVLIKQAYDAAKQVAIGDASTLVDRRNRAVESFAKMGITPDRICTALGIKGVDEINLEHLETLTGLRTAIKEGQTTIDQAFPAVVKESKGIFGGEKPAPTETASTEQRAAEPTKMDPRTRKPKAEPTSSPRPATGDGQSAQPAKESASAAAPAETAKASPLENDRTRLAAWLLEKMFTWEQIRGVVREEFGSWVDNITSLDQLSMQQAKVVYAARGGIESALIDGGKNQNA